MNSTSCKVLAIAFLCACAAAMPRAGRAQEAAVSLSKEDVLDKWAAALGGRENLQNARTIHVRATVKTAGLEGTYERWTTSRGEWRAAVDLSGAFRQVIIFDGEKGWVSDKSGISHELSGGMLKAAITSAYEASDSFLLPGRMPGKVAFAGGDTKEDAYVVRLEPEGGNALTVYLDKKTFLPAREEISGPTGNRTIYFSEWREFQGVRMPGTVRQSNGDARPDAVFTTETVEINSPVTAGLFEKPADTAAEIHFGGGAHEAVIPAEVYSQHVFVPVRVNGGETAWLFFDSGAEQSFVSKSLAEKSGLVFGGALHASGTGEGSTTMEVAKNAVLSIPGLEVPMSTLNVWDFSALKPMMGRPWDGSLGYDVISRVVARVDYEHKQITLYDPSTFVASESATALPLRFLGNLPVVRAKILLAGREPIEADCAVDSGADGLHLTTPFANGNRVMESMKRTVSASSVGAGGKATKEIAGRLAGLQLGPYLLREPPAAFSPDLKEGLLASSEIGALIGGEILERFTVTFDYPHKRILLEPNSHFSDRFTADQSGLSLLAKGEDYRRFEVDGVESGSPAEAAGIRTGDILTAIDGRPAREFDLDKIGKVFEQAGRVVRVTIGRNGRILKVNLQLKERL